MRWTPGGSTSDIEDRRDEGGGGWGGGGFGAGRLGCGGIIIVGILSLIFHQNLFTLFEGGTPAQQTPAAPDRERDAREQPEVDFITAVLNDVQDTWDAKLPQQSNRSYRHAKLVLFRDVTRSGCGLAQQQVGPFYCPVDEKVYLDLGFFDELRNRFGAPGQFAQAYVIAHEIGHHVQKILGIESQVRQLQQARPDAANPLSVRLELQADCFAGVWGNSSAQRKNIDESDVQSGLNAAAAVGDDRLQRMATGRVSPESFTHGSSAQRTSWFTRGLETGRLSACDTFQTH
ncbi:MAG: zinc metallopeptidase [Acidobacteriaceae bacterium]|nr:zinc metallopeptidase [Acidobacteriaceae bacterium]